MTFTSPGKPAQSIIASWDGFLAIHRYEDLAVILNVIQSIAPRRVVEFGTHQGGMAAFFASAVAPWGGEVLSVDLRQDPGIRRDLLARYPNLTLREADLLAATPEAEVLRWIAQPGTLLYCDNGAKLQEIQTYAPRLGRPGLLGTHDYGTEVDPDLVEPYLASLDFIPYRHAEFAALANADYWDSLTRFWVR